MIRKSRGLVLILQRSFLFQPSQLQSPETRSVLGASLKSGSSSIGGLSKKKDEDGVEQERKDEETGKKRCSVGAHIACVTTGCCEWGPMDDPSMEERDLNCIGKNHIHAMCMYEVCRPGIYHYDGRDFKTPWTCKALSPEVATKTKIAGQRCNSTQDCRDPFWDPVLEQGISNLRSSMPGFEGVDEKYKCYKNDTRASRERGDGDDEEMLGGGNCGLFCKDGVGCTEIVDESLNEREDRRTYFRSRSPYTHPDVLMGCRWVRGGAWKDPDAGYNTTSATLKLPFREFAISAIFSHIRAGLLENLTIPSVQVCAAVCAETVLCNSFAFDSSREKCIIMRRNGVPDLVADEVEGGGDVSSSPGTAVSDGGHYDYLGVCRDVMRTLTVMTSGTCSSSRHPGAAGSDWGRPHHASFDSCQLFTTLAMSVPASHTNALRFRWNDGSLNVDPFDSATGFFKRASTTSKVDDVAAVQRPHGCSLEVGTGLVWWNDHEGDSDSNVHCSETQPCLCEYPEFDDTTICSTIDNCNFGGCWSRLIQPVRRHVDDPDSLVSTDTQAGRERTCGMEVEGFALLDKGWQAQDVASTWKSRETEWRDMVKFVASYEPVDCGCLLSDRVRGTWDQGLFSKVPVQRTQNDINIKSSQSSPSTSATICTAVPRSTQEDMTNHTDGGTAMTAECGVCFGVKGPSPAGHGGSETLMTCADRLQWIMRSSESSQKAFPDLVYLNRTRLSDTSGWVSSDSVSLQQERERAVLLLTRKNFFGFKYCSCLAAPWKMKSVAEKLLLTSSEARDVARAPTDYVCSSSEQCAECWVIPIPSAQNDNGTDADRIYTCGDRVEEIYASKGSGLRSVGAGVIQDRTDAAIYVGTEYYMARDVCQCLLNITHGTQRHGRNATFAGPAASPDSGFITKAVPFFIAALCLVFVCILSMWFCSRGRCGKGRGGRYPEEDGEKIAEDDGPRDTTNSPSMISEKINPGNNILGTNAVPSPVASAALGSGASAALEQKSGVRAHSANSRAEVAQGSEVPGVKSGHERPTRQRKTKRKSLAPSENIGAATGVRTAGTSSHVSGTSSKSATTRAKE